MSLAQSACLTLIRLQSSFFSFRNSVNSDAATTIMSGHGPKHYIYIEGDKRTLRRSQKTASRLRNSINPQLDNTINYCDFSNNIDTMAARADKSTPYFPLSGGANDGYSKDGEATATCFCGAVQLAFVSLPPIPQLCLIVVLP